MFLDLFSIAFASGIFAHHFHPFLALFLKGHFPYVLANSCKVLKKTNLTIVSSSQADYQQKPSSIRKTQSTSIVHQRL